MLPVAPARKISPHHRFLRPALELTILALTASLPLLRYPDVIIPDTHIGLAIAPERLLGLMDSTWNTHASLGYDYARSHALIFPVGTFFLLINRLGIDPAYATQFWIAIWLFVAGLSMRFFVRSWLGRDARVPSLFAALMYMVSPYVITFITDTSMFFLAYALLPAHVGLALRILRREIRGSLGIALLGLTLLLVSALDIPALIINTTAVLLFSLGYCILARKEVGSSASRGLAVVGGGLALGLVLLAWSLVPLASSYAADPSTAGANLAAEGGSLYNRQTSYTEVLRSQGYWALYSGYGGRPYRPYQHYYLGNWFGIAAGYLLFILAGLGIALRRRDPLVLLLGALVAVTIPLVVGVYPPDDPSGIGRPLGWVFATFPLASIFRNTFKFAGILDFAVVSLAAGTLYSLLAARRVGRSLKVTAAVAVFGTMVAVSLPFFTGKLWWPEKQITRIPADWFQLAAWLNEQPGDGRVLYMPDMPAPVYLWGFPASEPGEVLINRPQAYNMPGVLSYPGDRFLAYLYAKLENDESTSQETRLLLSKARVEFLVVRNDVRFGYYPDTTPPYRVGRILRNLPDIEFVRTFGRLALYRVRGLPAPMVSIYTAPPELLASNQRGTLDEDQYWLNSIQSENGSAPARVRTLTSTRYVVDLQPIDSWTLLVLRQSYHGGWTAQVNAPSATASQHILADGYANGWLLPPFVRQVTLVHSPSEMVLPSRMLSLIGLIIVLLLLVRPLVESRLRWLISAPRRDKPDLSVTGDEYPGPVEGQELGKPHTPDR